MNKIFYSIIISFFTFINAYSQNINLDEYDIYIGDTLISKADFIENSSNLNENQSQNLEFKPITNGIKKAYYLNGKLASSGKIENFKENGFWEYWYSNGNKAR
ncbi:hypothetical protein [Empedobacter brevis]|uniref:hypothetical protein n=1 Tax=Empedobacter brevis TaxID=247 RepID=UPI0039B0B29D